MTAQTLAPPPEAQSSKEEQPRVTEPRNRHTGIKFLVVLAVWLIGWAIFKNRDTLTIPFTQLDGVDRWINHVRDLIQAASLDNWFFHGVIGQLTNFANWLVTEIGNWISHPAPGRPVPQIGWVGVTAIFGWIALAAAGWRIAILVVGTTVLYGVGGYWADSMDMLILTVLAVLVCIVVGVPVGIAMARRRWVSNVVTPILDAMQTMPSFAYLLPFVFVFGLGTLCTLLLTIVYAIPPLIRITEHGIRSVSPSTVEAAGSLGLTRRQLLRKVQLPMAKRTIVVGINQCTLAALAMATVAALVSAPGLGQDVLTGLTNLDVGQAAVPGLLLVIMAIALDRATTAASERSELRQRAGSHGTRNRRILLALAGVAALVAIYLSRTYLDFAQFPDAMNLGTQLADGINRVTDTVVNAVDTVTQGFRNAISYGFLNPLQNVLAQAPYWLMAPVLLAFSWVLAGWRALAATLVCEGVIFGLNMWHETVVTLTMVIVATVMVMIIALVLGVWLGRSRRADLVIRPILDAFQVIPPFAYLVPALALFGASRFTAITAAVAYASPIAVKLVTDGIRGVSPTTVEAAASTGTTRWQEIRKVQLPMARSGLVLAANQGLLYVLSMVVIGGMVGGGSLGYLVFSGFAQANLQGKGLAAGIAVTALGIMLDRVTRGIAQRVGD